MISVVLATYNEEANIAQCLDSVKDFADEIIIVDGESTDQTVAIAKRYTSHIITTTNKPNFHINKQMAMDAAKGSLVLQIDADEVVDQELKRFILKTHEIIEAQGVKQWSKNNPVAWNIPRKNLFLQTWLKKGGQYPDPVIRLYVNGFAKLPQKDVHEQIEVNGEVGWTEGHILHYSNPTFTDYMRKFNTYTSFKAQQLKEADVQVGFLSGLNYIVWKPTSTWFSLFIRHKGFKDGIPGFTFALFSGLHHGVSYLKLWELYQES